MPVRMRLDLSPGSASSIPWEQQVMARMVLVIHVGDLDWVTGSQLWPVWTFGEYINGREMYLSLKWKSEKEAHKRETCVLIYCPKSSCFQHESESKKTELHVPSAGNMCVGWPYYFSGVHTSVNCSSKLRVYWCGVYKWILESQSVCEGL